MNTDFPSIAVVGGLGHVGLPLSLVLAKSGFRVIVVDNDLSKIEMVRRGEFPFMEEGGAELLQEAKREGWRLSFSDQHRCLRDCDVVVLTVGTPVDEHLNPELSAVYEVIGQIQPYLHDGQVIILRSTLYPGTSEKIYDLLCEQGLKIGVSFCPERIAQGKALKELARIPQIISASDLKTLEIVRSLFQRVTPHTVELNLTEAEVAKLFSNTWRYMKFAVANQFYMITRSKQLDFEKIRDAMMFQYERALDFPKAGFAAGPCLFKDTMQLAAYYRQNFFLGHAAMLINETLPDFLVEQVKNQRSLKGVKVGILGMAFKVDNDDTRKSLACKLRKILQYEGARVMCTDPYVKDKSLVPLEKVLEECELIFIGCPHSVYRDIPLDRHHVIDVWNFWPRRSW